MRLIACICLVVSAFIAIARDITYRSSGVTVAKVVDAVSEQVGIKHAVSKELAAEIVVVSVKGVDPATFRERLADCLSAKWVKRSDGILELKIDTDLSANRRLDNQKAVASAVPAKIKSTREIYGATPVDPENAEWMSSLQLQLDLFEKVQYSVFESLLPNSRIVLATDPIGSQKRLGDVFDVVAKRKPNSNIKSVVLAIERGDHTPFITGSLRLLGGDSKLEPAVIGLFEWDKEPSNEGGKEIPWSAASLELSNNYRGMLRRAFEGMVSLSQNLRDVLSKPTDVDPISFGFGEGLLAVADEKGESLVATVTDDDIRGKLGYATPGMNTGNFWAAICRKNTLIASRKDGWIVVRPGDPIYARETRGDRRALEKLIARAKGMAWVSLDDLIVFACSNLKCKSIPGAFSLPFQAMVNYYGKPNEGFLTGFLRELQFFGLLSEAQREALLLPSGLTVAQLSAKAANMLTAYFYEPADTLGSWLPSDPTSAMPSGLPPDMRITATRLRSKLFYPMPDAGEVTVPARGRTAWDIARDKWVRLNNNDPEDEGVPEVTRVRLGSRAEWELQFVLRNETYASYKLADDAVPRDAPPTLVTDLPKEIQQQLDRAYEEFVKAFGGGGGLVPH